MNTNIKATIVPTSKMAKKSLKINPLGEYASLRWVRYF